MPEGGPRRSEERRTVKRVPGVGDEAKRSLASAAHALTRALVAFLCAPALVYRLPLSCPPLTCLPLSFLPLFFHPAQRCAPSLGSSLHPSSYSSCSLSLVLPPLSPRRPALSHVVARSPSPPPLPPRLLLLLPPTKAFASWNGRTPSFPRRLWSRRRGPLGTCSGRCTLSPRSAPSLYICT